MISNKIKFICKENDSYFFLVKVNPGNKNAVTNAFKTPTAFFERLNAFKDV